MMKKTTLIYMAAAICSAATIAQTRTATEVPTTATAESREAEGVTVSDMKMERNGNYLAVEMLMNLKGLKVGGNRAVLLTPRLKNGSDSVDLPSVGVYGRRRYYYFQRNGGNMLTGKEEMTYKASEKPETIGYNRVVPYEEWMNGATLTFVRSDYGCCNTQPGRQSIDLLTYAETKEFFPELIYVRPTAQAVKRDSLEGSAYIDFPVNKTVIYPDYRRNTAELGRIQATIDSVRNDRDVTITEVRLKGYASPESPYAHNRDLAIGRTAALKKYIQQLYNFPNGVIATAYEPEDWDGLREYVKTSNLAHRDEILEIIDSAREPDSKELAIKKTYPDEYRFLLQNCYPALRHTDYRISYTIRAYSDPDEMERIMKTHPQKLSLNELYLVAQKYEPGSDEFTEVFETAVRMYPDDKTANLNAGNAAMRRGDNALAAEYLAKAGDTPEAVYARGALAVRNGDLTTARQLLEEAKNRGVAKAAETLGQLPDNK